MSTLDPLSSAVMTSVLWGIVGGIALVAAVGIALKAFTFLNAASRAIVWMAALLSLVIIPAFYFVTHLPTATPPILVSKSLAPNAPDATIAIAPPNTSALSSVPPPSTPRRWNIDLPQNFSQSIFALYFLVVCALLVRLSISYVRLRMLRRHTEPAAPELVDRLQQWRHRCPTHRQVDLRISQRARSPLALGFFRPLIVMPAGLVLDLTQDEYDALGVHELAHLRRFDDWSNLLQRILQAVLFFHPGAHYIARQLNLERELACDDWVVSSHESKSYARCLTKVIELRRYHRGALLLSSGAFFGKRQIVKRVESLLDRSRNAATGISIATVLAIVLCVVALASQVSNLPSIFSFTQEAGATSSNRWSDANHDLRIKLRGDVTFSPDEQSIASISPDGFFVIDESKGWSERRLEVRPGPTGSPQTTYFINGSQKLLDGVGRAWAAGNYLFALREIGLDSEARVRRLLVRGGPSAVLQEIEFIHSDQVKRDYLKQLLEEGSLKNADFQRVNDSLQKISSDNDKADFLIAHQQDLATRPLLTSYMHAVNSINSDSDRSRVLMHLLQDSGSDPEIARLVSQSAKGMNSDNDKANVLLAIPSSTPGQSGCALLDAARNIQSDSDKARVLHDSAYIDSTECRSAYFGVVNRIESDSDRAGVLLNLLQRANLQPETDRYIASSAKSMNSDNDKANVLVPLSAHYQEQPFFDAVNTIESSTDRSRVLKAVLQNNPATPAVLSAIESASTISDDNEKTELLLAVAGQSRQPEVRTALQEACEKLSSDNDYRRVASALFKGAQQTQAR